MQLSGNKIFPSVFAGSFIFLGQTPWVEARPPSFDLLRGHTEIQMEYDEETGWWAGVSYTLSTSFDNPGENELVRIEADAMEYVLPPLSREISGRGSDFLIEPGNQISRISQGFIEGSQFTGLRVLIPNGAFQTGSGDSFVTVGNGNINLRLLSVTGSGPERGGFMGTWQDGSGFTPRRIGFNTSDGIDTDDEIQILRPGTHTHYNWAFTEAGVYEVNMELYGRMVDGTDSSFPFTITFQVPHDGILTELNARPVFNDGSWGFLCQDEEDSVTFGEKHCYLHLTEPLADNELSGWQAPFTFDLASQETSDTVGISAESMMSSPDFPGGVLFSLVEHIGPGEVILRDSDAEALFDTRDGLDREDSVMLGEGALSGQILFTREGVHHLYFEAAGLGEAGEVVSQSQRFLVRCGANLPANHSYAQWAESFEEAYELPGGALSDPEGDFDGDGTENQIEYLLDVSGANPVVSEKLGRLIDGDSGAGLLRRFLFMRDLHKDLLDDSSPSLFPAFSSDLQSWETIGAGRGRNGLPIVESEVSEDGLPNRLHELPVISGNARSLFMERALSNPIAGGISGFFRFESEVIGAEE